jgi:hypothetical protein
MFFFALLGEKEHTANVKSPVAAGEYCLYVNPKIADWVRSICNRNLQF